MEPITDHANTTTSQTTNHILCDALEPEDPNGDDVGCRAFAQIHDDNANVNLCVAHTRRWIAGDYVDGLGFRIDVAAQFLAWVEAGCPR